MPESKASTAATPQETSEEEFKKMWATYQDNVQKTFQMLTDKGSVKSMQELCDQILPENVRAIQKDTAEKSKNKISASTSLELKKIGPKIVALGICAQQPWALTMLRTSLIKLAEELPGRAAQVIDGILEAVYAPKEKKGFLYRMEPCLYEIVAMLDQRKTSADAKMCKDARRQWDKKGWFVLDPAKVKKIKSRRDPSESRASSAPDQSSSERKSKRSPKDESERKKDKKKRRDDRDDKEHKGSKRHRDEDGKASKKRKKD